MNAERADKYVVGTSGYSFNDWVGPWYPEGTRPAEMFDRYAEHFNAVEVNYTYYRMPVARTMESMVRRSPEGFVFWVKANKSTTHEGDRSTIEPFLAELAPVRESERLIGVLLQFPQSFHRTVDNRKYLASAIAEFGDATRLAVEFRHRSWAHPSTVEGLRERNAAMVIPDVPDIRGLFRHSPTITGPVGYLRPHSRDAGKWYSGAALRYDYSYSREELAGFLEQWEACEDQAEQIYVFFNNCHRGQAAENAAELRRMLGQLA